MLINDYIYLDYQASTPVDNEVFCAMEPYFKHFYANPHSSEHACGWVAAQAIEDATAMIAGLIGCDENEIVFTSGATEANNLALFGLARHAYETKRRRIVVSMVEHKSVLAVTNAIHKHLGYEVSVIPVDREGMVMLTNLERILSKGDVLFASIMLVNNEVGTIQPIKEISELCLNYGTILHCDGAQAPCTLNLSDIAQSVDLLSISAHKIYGPKGVGALFVRNEIQSNIEPLIYGGGQQNNLRSGTIPTALVVGMGAAANLLKGSQAEKERTHLRERRDNFIRKLDQLTWPIHLNGPKLSNRHCGNANVRFDGFSAGDILGTLQPKLAASTSSACLTGIPEPSHVLRAIGLTGDEIQASIRFSLGRPTTVQEIEKTVSLIDDTLSSLANSGLSQIR